MNTLVIKDVANLQAADHICIWDKTRWPFRYTHHGVVYAPGSTTDEIVIAHVWSPIDGFREAQADSSFRITSLTEFLCGRPITDMRRVLYNSSIVADALSKLGEVHRSRSDSPPIVRARCDFLLGLGKGHFNILSLNCEHVALWCKTGKMWSKQLFHRVGRQAPYIPDKSKDLLNSLEAKLEALRQEDMKRNDELVQLSGKRVYLRVSDTKYVKRSGQQLRIVYNDPKESDIVFRQAPTSFIATFEVKSYNCVRVILTDASTNEYVCAKAKSLKLVQRRSYHRESLFKFEYTWNKELQSRRHRRWYVGCQMRDGLMRTFNTRDRAARFEIVDADIVDKMSVEIDPATITGALMDEVSLALEAGNETDSSDGFEETGTGDELASMSSVTTTSTHANDL